MSPGEIKGHLRQLIKSKTTSKEQKEAVQLGMDAVFALKALQPFLEKVKEELAAAKDPK